MTVTHQPPDPPSQVSTRRPTPTSDSTETLNTPVQRFVADWLKTHDYPLDYEVDSDGVATITMTSENENELIDDLYATGDSKVFLSTLARAVNAIFEYDSCPTGDLEVLWRWVTARVPASEDQLVEELLHSIFTLRTADESLSGSALSIGLMYAIFDYDDTYVSLLAASEGLRSEGLISETGEYRDGRPVMMITPEGERMLRDRSDDDFDDEENIARVREFASASGEVCAGLSLAESELVFYVVTALETLEDERRNDVRVKMTTSEVAERATKLMRPGVLRAQPGEPEMEVSDEGVTFVMERLEAAGWVETRCLGDADQSWA